jgi:hypothetical protein
MLSFVPDRSQVYEQVDRVYVERSGPEAVWRIVRVRNVTKS